MLLALALCASTTHAGISAGFGGTPGAVNENPPRYDLEPLYHDGKAHRPDKRLLLRRPPSPTPRRPLARVSELPVMGAEKRRRGIEPVASGRAPGSWLVNENLADRVSAYAIDPANGTPAFLNTASANGKHTTHLSVHPSGH